MLLRLHVEGFKNLYDAELTFGPLTCLAGPNGVGKSNVFDALRFLGLLADRPILEAAKTVRGGHDPERLFSAGGDGRMSFEADLLIEAEGEDDYGQAVTATHRLLRYRLELALRREPQRRIEIASETLRALSRDEAEGSLAFSRTWLEALPVLGEDTSLISTQGDQIALHVPGSSMQWHLGRADLPRTALSSADQATRGATAVLVRREMRSWRVVHLSPAALRGPDDLGGPDRLAADGRHLAATLHRLAKSEGDEAREAAVYAGVANLLAEVVEGVESVEVEPDETRRTLQLMLKQRSGEVMPASSLSDGTLRFLALAVLATDPLEAGVVCLEEPENGLYPERLGALVGLLYDLAADPTTPPGPENPQRQVIFDTHSPILASKLRPDDVLLARRGPSPSAPRRVAGFTVEVPGGTWRAELGAEVVAPGRLRSFLRGASALDDGGGEDRLGQLPKGLGEEPNDR